jgi:hypothetical protein
LCDRFVGWRGFLVETGEKLFWCSPLYRAFGMSSLYTIKRVISNSISTSIPFRSIGYTGIVSSNWTINLWRWGFKRTKWTPDWSLHINEVNEFEKWVDGLPLSDINDNLKHNKEILYLALYGAGTWDLCGTCWRSWRLRKQSGKRGGNCRGPEG